MATVLDVVNKILVSVGETGRGETATSDVVDIALDYLNQVLGECTNYLSPGFKQADVVLSNPRGSIYVSNDVSGDIYMTRPPNEINSIHYLDGNDWILMPQVQWRDFQNVSQETDSGTPPVAWCYSIRRGTDNGYTTLAEIRFQQPIGSCSLRVTYTALPSQVFKVDEWPFYGPLSSYLINKTKELMCAEIGAPADYWAMQAEKNKFQLRQMVSPNLLEAPEVDYDTRNGIGLGFL